MSVLLADQLDEDVARQAYRDIRTARRRNRVRSLDAFDAFYKAYVTALVSAVALYASASALGDDKLTLSELHTLQFDGAGWLGLLVAFAVAIGLRSGGRGGPVAFERADVRHVLMAPVDRRQSIRKPALRALRYTAFLGISVGAAAGLIASRRMPDAPAEWVATGAVFGLGLAVISYSAAAVAGGHQLKVWMADTLALLILGWSVGDIWFGLQTSPLTFLGESAIVPLEFHPVMFIGLAAVAVVAVWGMGVVNRSSIEAAERRSRLVGQLRFAATLQDVRTVMVLQRQLSQESLRQRPWIRLPKRKRLGFSRGRVHRKVFYKRSLQGILRWPALRLVRLLFFAAVAGFAGLGAWTGTSALVVVGGVALWMAALDLCESLAQEVDHPDRLRTAGQQIGAIYLQHVFVPGAILIVLTMLAFIPAFILGNQDLASALLPMGVFAAGSALAGATLAVNAKPPGSSGMVETPETASIKFIWRVLLPPALGVLGFVPLLAAHRSWTQHHDKALMVEAANPATILCMATVSVVLAWLRFGDQMRENISTEQAAAAKQRAEKAAAKNDAKGGSKSSGSKLLSTKAAVEVEDEDEHGEVESTAPTRQKQSRHGQDSNRQAAKAKHKATQNKRKKR